MAKGWSSIIRYINMNCNKKLVKMNIISSSFFVSTLAFCSNVLAYVYSVTTERRFFIYIYTYIKWQRPLILILPTPKVTTKKIRLTRESSVQRKQHPTFYNRKYWGEVGVTFYGFATSIESDHPTHPCSLTIGSILWVYQLQVFMWTVPKGKVNYSILEIRHGKGSYVSINY